MTGLACALLPTQLTGQSQRSAKPLLQQLYPCTAIVQLPEMHAALTCRSCAQHPCSHAAASVCVGLPHLPAAQARKHQPMQTADTQWALSQLLHNDLLPWEQRHCALPDTCSLHQPSCSPTRQPLRCTSWHATKPGMPVVQLPSQTPCHSAAALESVAPTLRLNRWLAHPPPYRRHPRLICTGFVPEMQNFLLACRSYPPRRRAPSPMLPAARRGRAARGRPLPAWPSALCPPVRDLTDQGPDCALVSSPQMPAKQARAVD